MISNRSGRSHASRSGAWLQARVAAALVVLLGSVAVGTIPALAVGPADPATSTITASRTTITANGVHTSTITVQAKDSSGANLTTGNDSVQLFTTAGSLSSVTDNGNGTYTSVLTSGTTVTTATINGKINNVFMSDDATVAFEATADPAQTTMTASPTSIVADGVTTSTITVQGKKADGSNKVAGGEVVTLTTTKGTFVGCPGDGKSDCPATDADNGTYTLVLRSETTTGTATISGKIDPPGNPDPPPVNITTTSPTVQMIPGPASAAKTTITANPTTRAADGADASTITVTAKDANNNALTAGGDTVTVSTDKGTFAGGCTANCATTDAGNGTYTASLTSTSTGTATVSGKINGADITTGNPTVTFGVGSGDGATSLITSDKASIPVDTGSATITVVSKDAAGNPRTTGGEPVTLSTTLGTLSSVNDVGNGTYTATLTAGSIQGTAIITGTINGEIIQDTEQVVIREAAGAQSTINASPETITANGTSTSTITVIANNSVGLPIGAGGDEIKLTTEAGTFVGCPGDGKTNCPATHDNANPGNYTLTLTSSTVADTAVVISGKANGTTITDTATVVFAPGPASTATSTITPASGSIPADGTTTTKITVRLKDQFGNNLTSGGATVSLLTSAGSLSPNPPTDKGDGTYEADLKAASSAALATVVGKIGANFISDDAQVAFIGVPKGAQSVIARSPTSIPADGLSTSAITVQLRDSAGNNVTAPPDGTTVEVFTDLGSIGAATHTGNGVYSATLTSGTTPGTAAITGKVNTETIGNPTTVIFEGPASKDTSQITASPTNIHADGTSTSTITVQLKDGAGNNRTTGGDTVELTTSAGTFTMPSPPPTCSSDCPATDNGNGTYTLVLKAPAAPATAIITGKVNTANIVDTAQVVFRRVADPAKSQITADPTQLTADGTSTSTITVQLKDASDQNVTSGGDTVTLTTNRGALTPVTDNGNGTYTATLTSSTTSGTATISGIVNTQAITDTASVLFVAPPSKATSTITASPTSIVADGASTSTITVQLKDAGGSNIPVGGATVTLATNRGSLSPVTDQANGTYTATLTSSGTPGLANITGTVGGEVIDDDANVTFTAPSSPANTTITPSAASIVANGVSTSTITVQVKDTDNVNVTNGGETVRLSTDKGTFTGSCTTACTPADNANGTYSMVLTSSTTVGTATVTGTLNGVTIGDNATVTFTPGPASLSKSTITATPASIVANGVEESVIKVELIDANDNPLTSSGGTVVLNTTGGTLSSVVDNNDGTYTATLKSSSVGSATVTGTLNGEALDDSAAVSFVPGPASGATTLISASPASIPADGTSTSTITVQAKDSGNNNLTEGGDAVVLATSGGGSLSSVTDNGNGTYTATLLAPTTTGSTTISGTINAGTITDTAPVTFTPGPAHGSKSQISANPESIPANGTSTSQITVQLKDINDNNLTAGGDAVALNASLGSVGPATDNGNGTYTATFTSAATPGVAVISGTVNGGAISDTANVIMTGVASAAKSQVTAAPTTIPADGTSTSTITIRLKDADENNIPVGGDTVTVSTNRGTIGSACPSGTDCATQDNGDGTYTATLKSSTTAGSALVTAKVNGTLIADDATVLFREVASAATSLITASPLKIPADGTSTAAVSVQLKDASGTNLTQGGDNVALFTSRGALGAVTDNGNGTYSATLTSSTSAGVATITGTVNGASITDNATVEFKATPELDFFEPLTLDDAGVVFFCGAGSLPEDCTSDPVHGVTDQNFVLRLTPDGANLLSDVFCVDFADNVVSCSAGPVYLAVLVPRTRLVPGEHYVMVVNPSGAPSMIKDELDTDVPTGSFSFRGSRNEQENSLASSAQWGYVRTSSAFGGWYTTERLPGARAIFPFTGSRVGWYTTLGPDQGEAEVFIDNVSQGIFDQYSATTRYGAARFFTVPFGAHTLVVKVLGRKGTAAATNTKVSVDAFSVDGVLNRSPAINYLWSTVRDSLASGGFRVQSDTYGASYAFTFRGTAIVWYTKFGPDQGIVIVYIDGVSFGIYDLWAGGVQHFYRRFTGLSDALHTFRVVGLGRHRSGGTGNFFSVDRLQIS